MTTAYYSTVLDQPLETVWSLIRDFNNYPAYIEGVSESAIEDDRSGDEVGAVRRFCYLGSWVRQRLAGHSDQAHSLTYAGIEPLPYPSADASEAVSPVRYEGTMHLMGIIEGNRTFIEWSVALDAAPQDAERWHALFQSRFQSGQTLSQGRWRGAPRHSRPRVAYSAASLWPSRALSLWISSSAASAITVPGGKMASAPALYSVS